ncbi:hypothetical protein LTR70_009040 [Exophiala xenobiotica]|uniref:Ribosomal protein L1 n=1 Tax=Lithohypha guttulata TaxID=1690604 RepID=A0ABR0K101_9EURO|nr:hypothetical protein LTR24_008737 [Lithohypha guttulata]KAK5311090.1 hypothetical protein LTR70_009040 [Exophiala xenobiotica]
MNSLRSSCSAHTTIPVNGISLCRTQLPIRTFSSSSTLSAQKTQSSSAKAAAQKAKQKRKKKKYVNYKMPNLSDLTQYTLCDAIQYIKAFEAGHNSSIPKYDLAIRLKTKKDGPVLRNQIKLPYSVKTDIRVCVLVDPNSKAGKQAKEAGAAIVGLEDVFDQVKNGKIDFDRCITTPEMLPQLNKAGLPRILGPRGLMPSVKLGTVTDNMSASVKNMLGASTYRERQGVVRMAVGRLAFTPEQLRDNVKALISQVKRQSNLMSETQNFSKEVYEVVLSSTNSPGFSLNGEFRTANSIPTQQLAIA